MTQPDPDPAVTPAIDAGGGVPVGDTPPAEAATFGVSAVQEPPGRTMNSVAFIALIVFIVLVVAGAVIGAISMF